MKRLLVALGVMAVVASAAELIGLHLPWNTTKVIVKRIESDSTWTDTSFFKHGRQSDSSYAIYYTVGTGDTINVFRINGRVDKVVISDTLLASLPYKLVVHAESILVTKGYVDKSDTTFFTHNDQTDSTANIYFQYGVGDSVRLAVLRGSVGRVTVGDTIVLKGGGISYLGVVNADSQIVSKFYIDQADTARFKHGLQSDSVAVLYFANAIGDSVKASYVGGRSPWNLGDSVIAPLTAYRGVKAADSLLATVQFVRDSAGVDSAIVGNLISDSLAADTLVTSAGFGVSMAVSGSPPNETLTVAVDSANADLKTYIAAQAGAGDSSWTQATITQLVGGSGGVVVGVQSGTGGFGANDTAGDAATDTGAYAGGTNCAATAKYATIAGGIGNKASGNYSASGGGWTNIISGTAATVSGGRDNQATSSYNVVGGGYYNQSIGTTSAIGGGTSNTVSATGDYGIIPGGQSNDVSARYGAVFGTNDTVLAGDTAAGVHGFGLHSNGKYSQTIRGSGGTWISAPFIKDTLLVRTAGAAYAATRAYGVYVDSCNGVDTINLAALNAGGAEVLVYDLRDSVFITNGATVIDTLTIGKWGRYFYGTGINRWLVVGTNLP